MTTDKMKAWETVLGAFDEIEFFCDGKEDADDGIPNLAMKCATAVEQARAALQQLRPDDGAEIPGDRADALIALNNLEACMSVWAEDDAEIRNEGGRDIEIARSFIKNADLSQTVPDGDNVGAGWMLISEAPLDVYGILWCKELGVRTDISGHVRDDLCGGRLAIGAGALGYDFTHFRRFPAPPAAIMKVGE